MALPKIYQKLLERLPLSGGTMTGTLVVAQGNNSIDGGVADGTVQFNANGNMGGANVRLYGAQNTQCPGQFRIWAQIGNKSRGLFGDVNGDVNGSLTWGGKPVLCGESGGFPVGFLALYAGSNVPDGWFRCDGSTVANMATNYPKLYAVLGTNVLPNYSGRFPMGATAGINAAVEAGLPDITGNMIYLAGLLSGYLACSAYPANEHGCFYSEQYSSTYALPNVTLKTDLMCARTHFAASQSNAIYGSSTTVTPPSVKCTYLIRHD